MGAWPFRRRTEKDRTETGARFYIRTAALADVRPVMELKNRVWRDAYGPFRPPEFFDRVDAALDETVQYWQKRVSKSEKLFLAEDLRGNVVGTSYASAPVEQTLAVAADAQLELRILYVAPEVQGNGLGAQLMAAAVGDTEPVALWVLGENQSAIDFYAAHGFSAVAEVPGEGPWEGLTEKCMVRGG